MRILVLGILILLNFIFESTIFQYTRIFGIKPDFTIMLITSYAIMRGSVYGGFIGLMSGFLNDLIYGKSFGVNSLSYILTGYIIGQSQENVFKDSFILCNLILFCIHLPKLVLFYFVFKQNKYFYIYIFIEYMIPQSNIWNFGCIAYNIFTN